MNEENTNTVGTTSQRALQTKSNRMKNEARKMISKYYNLFFQKNPSFLEEKVREGRQKFYSASKMKNQL